MNKVILMGRLTSDPELRQTQSGIASCRFRLAVNRRFADKQTGERQADFFSCTAWRQTAEFVDRYFRKGSMIIVEGSLRTCSYQDKKYSDVTHYTTDIYVDSVEFGGAKPENQPVQNPTGGGHYYTPDTSEGGSSYPHSLPDTGGYEEILVEGDVPF